MKSGEQRIVRDALRWGLAATIPASAVGYWIRDGKGAVSVAAGALLVIGNAALAAAIVTRAARKNDVLAAAWALPSYAIRMLGITGMMALALRMPFIDKTTFLASICIAVIGTLAIEARTYIRTPWAAMTLMKDHPTKQGS